MAYQPNEHRYNGSMPYRRCGCSGVMLPVISLGLWHNFGSVDVYTNARALVHTAFDIGITHFDIANNYGPEPGSAEITFGNILKNDLRTYRDELIISTKAGYGMWPGPYGDHGSKKYLISSLDQSLKRLGMDYVDIFYHHRPDVDTPMEETCEALVQAVRQGKALYVGISNYQADQARKMIELLAANGVHCLIHQPRYSMLDRWIENGLTDVLEEKGVGSIVFSPLAQGVLTDRYLHGIPKDSRANIGRFLNADKVNTQAQKVSKLREVAADRGQNVAQLALSWVLRGNVTSALIGASKPQQIIENAACVDKTNFTAEELSHIEAILAE